MQDYALHHSEVKQAPQEARRAQPRRPPWTTDHRRVPEHRAANRHLDLEQRPAGTNTAEFTMIQVMLHGVWLNSVVARVWRNTGGRINRKIFHYEIGGEW
ncbi:hypothetical protein ASPZODRAFT_25417 [Penicilliopsis zonata CBS 506.65]|uniref:Uncharacterized protein n=1 Tax=Penicilliopsis zonata CBS 506.65 TaxID=1073090 RepID=A0A1L9SJF5_9EURO|nr:hypothetical protein ASPZODRAFT_25417 [Penicilliopsis zonata CBS 506.65]OJJ47359.1 hypothetical protein ASPZODRAFT_25417 [Penicilliopsis zonata CBS 506.65]